MGEMRRAAYELDQQAERIRRNADAMSSDVRAAWWHGDDATRFKADWENRHDHASKRIVHELQRLAANIRAEAARQERASVQ